MILVAAALLAGVLGLAALLGKDPFGF